MKPLKTAKAFSPAHLVIRQPIPLAAAPNSRPRSPTHISELKILVSQGSSHALLCNEVIVLGNKIKVHGRAKLVSGNSSLVASTLHEGWRLGLLKCSEIMACSPFFETPNSSCVIALMHASEIFKYNHFLHSCGI
jgi:hypothetical protein